MRVAGVADPARRGERLVQGAAVEPALGQIGQRPDGGHPAELQRDAVPVGQSAYAVEGDELRALQAEFGGERRILYPLEAQGLRRQLGALCGQCPGPAEMLVERGAVERDDRADPGVRLDEPLLAEDAEGLPHGRPADPETLPQRVLTGQLAAVGVDARTDLLGEDVGDAVMLVNLSRHV